VVYVQLSIGDLPPCRDWIILVVRIVLLIRDVVANAVAVESLAVSEGIAGVRAPGIGLVQLDVLADGFKRVGSKELLCVNNGSELVCGNPPKGEEKNKKQKMAASQKPSF